MRPDEAEFRGSAGELGEGMARHLLSAREVQTADEGDHRDGDGLFLRVKANSTASWVLRYSGPTGRRRELGLGGCDRASIELAGASLKRARKKADDARDKLDKGIDPIDAREAERMAAREAEAKKKAESKSTALTLRRFARAYHEKHIEPVHTGKHGQQWLNSVEQHIPARLLDSPMGGITAIDLLDELVPIMRKVPETGARIYQRLVTVFDAAVIDALRPDNPATPIRKELRRRAGRRERGSFASMPYRQVLGFIEALRKVHGNSARCLEFTVLTAARTSEALTADWSEFDMQARTWTVPAAKMKGREPHTVYLTDRTIEILENQVGQHERLVFPSSVGKGVPMSNMALLMALRRHTGKGLTVHGFRASFSTWANEFGIARPDVIEAALAHNESDRVRAAYNRATFIADRRALMVAWGDFLTGRPVTRVDGTAVTDAHVLTFPPVRQQAA
jgi:integrase